MATRADVDRIQVAYQALMLNLKDDLDQLFASLAIDDPEAARNLLVEIAPALVDQYGDAAIAIAAEWFQELRARAAPRARAFRPLAGDHVPREAIQSRVRYAAGHLFTDNPRATLTFLQSALTEYALHPGRQTVIRSVRADPAKPSWARVPRGDSTCAFCLMLASRGATYDTRTSARFRSSDGEKFHGDCDCAPVAIWPGDQLPAGYNPKALKDQYEVARDAADTGSTSAILSELRKQRGVA